MCIRDSFYHVVFDENGVPSISQRTLTRRAGSDKAGLNAEAWAIFARWESGAPPTWRKQAFGLVALTDGERTTFLPVAFHREQAAAARVWCITIQVRGLILGFWELT